MIRICTILFVAYAMGHETLEGARPQALDRPLAAFHDDVNALIQAAGDPMAQIDRRAVLAGLRYAADAVAAR